MASTGPLTNICPRRTALVGERLESGGLLICPEEFIAASQGSPAFGHRGQFIPKQLETRNRLPLQMLGGKGVRNWGSLRLRSLQAVSAASPRQARGKQGKQGKQGKPFDRLRAGRASFSSARKMADSG